MNYGNTAPVELKDMNATSAKTKIASASLDSIDTTLAAKLKGLDSQTGAELLATLTPTQSAAALKTISPDLAHQMLSACELPLQNEILAHISSELKTQWKINLSFPEESVGRLMDPPVATFAPHMAVQAVVEQLRELVKHHFITYVYVTDERNVLLGLVVMRDLLFADPNSRMEDIMLKNPFALQAATPLMDAMKEVLSRHFPVYPVLNDNRELIGLVRGFRLFEAQAIEISAQAGSMVGVEKEERLSTHWWRSFKYRHPWLQLNLLTAFVAGGVVSYFQGTIDQIVILAAFLPVLAGQSGNTGCQALAVTLRGMTLGELSSERVAKVVAKEGMLGFMNGALVGVSAAVGMYILATSQHNPQALTLSLIVLAAMICSCFVSGISGALVPLGLKKLGADPATASSIFLTTATDVASMGMLLALATWILM